MWRTPFPLRLKFLAATTSADKKAVMSSSHPPHRGGRNQWRRGFSGRANSGGRGHPVSGDSHLNSVREMNLGFRRGNISNRNSFQPQQFGYYPRPPSPYNQRQPQFSQPPPPHQYIRYQRLRQPFDQNQAARPSRPRNSKPWDYREWEYAKNPPPPDSERFVVLSYNILADYHASSHRDLYFHIPHHMMNWEWRKRNLMFELGLWSADVMCFQEVDKFHDLEEQLRSWGYSGIWKMRTGTAIDGCAIFWRTSRFKLLYEEYIEFNKHELRDNVAQICVLELLSQSTHEDTAAPLKRSANSNKVVICNIHVLYNPRRGEIKLGQVRRLLDRAHAVSKSWDDAPVVLCGDFNCTPKSPLYNFISEQKLDLSEVDRDKVSGQVSAEIPMRRSYNPNSGAQSGDFSVQVLTPIDKENGMDKKDSHSNTQQQNNLDRNMKDTSINLSQSSETTQDLSDISCINLQIGGNDNTQFDKVTTETQHDAFDVPKTETGSAFSISVDSSNKSSSCCHNEGKFPVNQMDDDMQNSSCPENVCSDVNEIKLTGTDVIIHSNEGTGFDDIVMDVPINQMDDDMQNSSCPENVCSDVNEIKLTGTDVIIHSNEGTGLDDTVMDDHSNRVRTDPEFLNASKSDISLTGPLFQTHSLDSIEVVPPGSIGSQSSESFENGERVRPSIPYQVDFSGLSAGIDIEIEEKLDNLSLKELDKTMVEGGNVVEDNNAFVAALYGDENVNSTNSRQSVASNLDHSSKEFCSSQNYQFQLLSDEVPDDLSPSFDSQGAEPEQATYDPAGWSPKDIATATGDEDCNFLQHHLQLKSTYTEVEHGPGTRDSDGEPLVTSYHRRFLGTVDYIWRSEGLQTVRVLAPIPKHAMQWTRGFPTKKWGSDHIALASELAFTKDCANPVPQRLQRVGGL